MHASPHIPTHSEPAHSMAEVWMRPPAEPEATAGFHDPVHGTTWTYERQAPAPVRDGIAWMLAKHVVQVAFIAMTFTVVLTGGNADTTLVGYVATAYLLLGVVVVADRRRFREQQPRMVLVEVVAPVDVPEPLHADPGASPLVPLAADMAAALPWRIDVT